MQVRNNPNGRRPWRIAQAWLTTCFAVLAPPAWGQLGDPVRTEEGGTEFRVQAAEDFQSDPGMIVDPVPQQWTLESLESMALAASPSIQRASALVNAARGRAVQAGLKPNPDVGIDFQQLGFLTDFFQHLVGGHFFQSPCLSGFVYGRFHEVGHGNPWNFDRILER